jgi:site-specific recombinase XerD
MPRRVLPVKRPVHTLQTAAAVFLDRPDLSSASRRSYTQTLERMTHAIGVDRSLGTLDGAAVETAVQAAWGHCAPATWNRHVAPVRSFIAFCRRHGWLAEEVAAGLDRRRDLADRTKAIPRAELERLW